MMPTGLSAECDGLQHSDVIGTFGGAVYAAIIGLLIPHTTAIAQLF
jgi:hypothetical protein